jgi:hypothetical protein
VQKREKILRTPNVKHLNAPSLDVALVLVVHSSHQQLLKQLMKR